MPALLESPLVLCRWTFPINLSTRAIRSATEFFASAGKLEKTPSSQLHPNLLEITSNEGLQVEHRWLLYRKSRLSGSGDCYPGSYGFLELILIDTFLSQQVSRWNFG
ncbi:hypothetical protein J1N35_028635 [Gossypium stocksii]|uniref:Uncharacterized protein n=1 Tax=Gossypium stocksii TaxID=47602 RepID=A0A9D3UWK0_9ROSI|nr:hypothetical protein J1N35_028635 [Gossypium stocksii]